MLLRGKGNKGETRREPSKQKGEKTSIKRAANQGSFKKKKTAPKLTLGKKTKEYLERLYYSVSRPGSLQSFQKIYATIRKEKKFKINEAQLRRWLAGQETYTVHRQADRQFLQNRVIVQGIGDQYDTDLMIMIQEAEENDGNNYILMVIDVFSRCIWMEAIPTKSNEDVIEAFKKIFKRAPLQLNVQLAILA